MVYLLGYNLFIFVLFKKGGFVVIFEVVSFIFGGDFCFNDDEIELSRSFGEFVSYGFFNFYFNDVKCIWIIIVFFGYFI